MADEVVTPPVENQLPPVDPKLAKMEKELEEQRRITQQLNQRINQAQPQAQPQGQVDIDALNKQFYKEPVATSVAIVNQAINEALSKHGLSGRETLIQVAKDKVRAKNPELFDKYATEIDLTVKSTVDQQYHDNINVWENAANIAYGNHMSEIRDMARASDPTKQAPAIKVSEGGPAVGGGRQGDPPTGAGAKLSDEEKGMAKRLGVELEAYAQGKKDYEGQTDRGPSPWDRVVTFSSTDARRAARAKRKAAAK